MTKGRLPRAPRKHDPQSFIDLRVLVLLCVAALTGWLAVVRPAIAAAIALGLTVLYLLHRMVGR